MASTQELIAQAEKDLSGRPAADLIKMAGSAPAKPKSNLREDVTFLGSEKAGKTASAFFPRTAKAAAEGKGYGKQALGAGNDLLSLLGRVIASGGTGPQAVGGGSSYQDEKYRKMTEEKAGDPLESLADIKGETLSGKIIRDPGTAAALMTIPFTGGMSGLPVYARLAAQGGLAGAASAGAHQSENLLEDEGIKPGQAAGEIALNALLPVAAKGGGELAKKAGKGMMQTILKPSKYLRETEKVDMGDVIETLGSVRPLKGSLSGMGKTATKMDADLTKRYDDIVTANAKKKIPVRGNLGVTKKAIEDAFTQEAKYGDVIGGLRKGADYWDDIVKQQGSQSGWYELPRAVEFRKSLGRAGRYNVNKDPRELEGPAQFAREAYKNLTAAESRYVPDLEPVKKSLENLYPLQEAVENAMGRTGNNLFPGLTDNLALNAAAQAHELKWTLPGLAQFAANRALRAPQAATGTYRLGQTMSDPSVIGEIRKRAIERALAQTFRED